VSDEAPVSRNGGPDLSQFFGFLNEAEQRRLSQHARPGVGVTIPAGATSVFDSRIRQAANKLGIGVKVVFYDHTTAIGQTNKVTEGKVRAVVQTAPKKAYKPRQPKTEAPAAAVHPAESVVAAARQRKG